MYDYHFIIKELAKEFECITENAEKYITFSVPIKKELDNDKTITYKLKLKTLDLCQAHYQVLFIIYLKGFTVISARIVNHVLTVWCSNMIN